MMARLFSLSFVLVLALCCSSHARAEPLVLDSPDGNLRLAFQLGLNNEPAFQVAYRDVPVASGVLGLEFAG